MGRTTGKKGAQGGKGAKGKKGGKKVVKDHGFNKRGHGAPIVFDPEARTAHLQGFSDRKRERRAYGLAMQKVKDRKARLEERKELKAAMKEQVEDAEKHKEALLKAVFDENPAFLPVPKAIEEEKDDANDEKPAPRNLDEPIEKVQLYQDVQTQCQFGGEVIVTCSTTFPNESDNEEDERKAAAKVHVEKTVDARQAYAGKVEKFLSKLKGNMPAKKKKAHMRQTKTKGNHGAAGMKGMAGSGDLKVAQQVLAKSQAKVGKKGKATVQKGRKGKAGKR